LIAITYVSIGLQQLMEINDGLAATTGPDYDRSHCRYASDLTDEE